MAGDWIKMQINLWTHPKVVRMMSALNADTVLICGALYRIWSIADEHTIDGFLEGYTIAIVDKEVQLIGFGQALQDVGWLQDHGDKGVQIVDFEAHMGKGAKRRAMESRRKKLSREKGPIASAPNADRLRTREEREKRESIYNRFDRFWIAYPKKQNKIAAQRSFEKLNPNDTLLEKIYANISQRIKSDQWNTGARKKFVLDPVVYLRDERWNDESLVAETTAERLE